MLRILHTADWHLGKTLRGYSREWESRRALQQITALVEQHQPDACVVAGDVFDTANPQPESLQLYYETLVRLHQVCPHMQVIVTSGNHDAASRLEAPREILAAIRVRVVGNVRRHEGQADAGRHLVAVTDRNGSVVGHVLAVSYPTAACLPAVIEEGTSSRVARATAELYRSLLEATREKWEGLPLVVTGHLHVAGAEESAGSERRILVGGENAVPVSMFPREADYVALGHLHQPQRVGGNERIRYSGSLYPLSAAEAGYRHGVLLVEIEGKDVRVEPLPLERSVAFHRVPAAGYLPFQSVEAALREVVIDGQPPFVQLCLERTGLPVAYRESLDQIAEEVGVRLVETRVEAVEVVAGPMPMTQVADHDPSHFFALAFQRSHGREMTERHKAIFHDVVEGVQGQ